MVALVVVADAGVRADDRGRLVDAVGVDLGRDERRGVAERTGVEDGRELPQHAGVLDPLRSARAPPARGCRAARRATAYGRGSSGKSHCTAFRSSRSRSSSAVLVGRRCVEVGVSACVRHRLPMVARPARRRSPRTPTFPPVDRQGPGTGIVAPRVTSIVELLAVRRQPDVDDAAGPVRRGRSATSSTRSSDRSAVDGDDHVAGEHACAARGAVGRDGHELRTVRACRSPSIGIAPCATYPFSRRSSAIVDRACRSVPRTRRVVVPVAHSTMPLTAPVRSTSAPPADQFVPSASVSSEAAGHRTGCVRRPRRRSTETSPLLIHGLGLAWRRRAEDPDAVAGLRRRLGDGDRAQGLAPRRRSDEPGRVVASDHRADERSDLPRS